MLKLSRYEHVLSAAVQKLGFKNPYELLLAGRDEEVASALAEHPELAEQVLSARAELKRIAESGDERVANLIVNYLLLRVSGYTVPKTLELELAKTIPGVYVVSGERVLVPKPFESPPDSVSIDPEYMGTVVEHLVKVGENSIVVAGVEYGVISYNYIYKALFNTRVAEAAVLMLLLDTCKQKSLTCHDGRVHREKSKIVAEAAVDLKAMADATETGLAGLPGTMKVSLTISKERKQFDTVFVAVYEDEVLKRVEDLRVGDYVDSYAKDVVDKVINSVIRHHRLLKAVKEKAESSGYSWIVEENKSLAKKTVKVNDLTVDVIVKYMIGEYSGVEVTLVVPDSTETLRVVDTLVSDLNASVSRKEDAVYLNIYHELTRESAHSAIELAESLVAKTRKLLLESKGTTQVPEEHVNEVKIIGALLLKVVKPDVYRDIFEKLGTSFYEALKSVFKNAMPYEISRMYTDPRLIISELTRYVDVLDNGEPTLFGRVIDEYLAPFGVDKKTALSVKRAIVETYTFVQQSSLLATIALRGVQITPELLKKMVAYGDTPPVVLLEREYDDVPLWQHLSDSEKLAVAIRLATRKDLWNELVNSNALSPEDGKILAKAACAKRLQECTALAFRELRDELMIPRHVVLKRVGDDIYMDTGVYLIKIDDYDVDTDTYTFVVRVKTGDKQVEIKGRSVRDVIAKMSEEEELLSA